MNYIEWGREVFKQSKIFNNCIEFENAPPKKLLEQIIDKITDDTLIGIYYKYDYLTENIKEYGYEILSKNINDIWDFYLKYPDIFYYTILVDTNKKFILSVELGSENNFICGNDNILDILPKDNDFSIFRE